MPSEQKQAAPAEAGERLEDLRLRIGLRVQLLIARSGNDTPLASSLIGYVPNEFLIVKSPTEGGFAVPLATGAPLKLRLFTGIHVVEFATSLLRQFAAPLSYWHLDYPQSVRAVALRAARRARVDLEASVSPGEGGEPLAARIMDLSANGALLVAPREVGSRDALVRIDFAFPAGGEGESTRMSVSARIRTVKTQPAAGDRADAYLHGVQFEDMADGEQMKLRTFVLQRIADSPDDGG